MYKRVRGKLPRKFGLMAKVFTILAVLGVLVSFNHPFRTSTNPDAKRESPNTPAVIQNPGSNFHVTEIETTLEDLRFAFAESFENFESYPHNAAPSAIKDWKAGARGQCRVDAQRFVFEDPSHVLFMRNAGGDDWQRGLMYEGFDNEVIPPLSGHWRFEYKFWESSRNHDGNLWLADTEGKPLIGAGTENPQWEVVLGDRGEVVNDGRNGNDYEHWIHVVIEVQTEVGRARVMFNDLEDSHEKTYGWFALPKGVKIGEIGLGPDAVWYVDDLCVERVVGGEKTTEAAD